MKKLVVLALALMMSGCANISNLFNNDTSQEPDISDSSDSVASTVTCTDENDESIVFDAVDDEVTKQTEVIYFTYEEAGISEEMEAEQIEAQVQALNSIYDDLDGVVASCDIEDTRIRMTVTIDYEAAHIDALIDAGLITQGENENEYVSLENSIETREANGYACETN